MMTMMMEWNLELIRSRVHADRHTQTDKQTGRHTNKETERWRGGKTDIYKKRVREKKASRPYSSLMYRVYCIDICTKYEDCFPNIIIFSSIF